MIKGLTYTILTTSDMPTARRFWTETLGLAVDPADDTPGFGQFVTAEGTTLAIMDAPHGAPADLWLFLAVDDVDAAYTAWTARGVETLTEPHDEDFGRTFAFRDPDGRTLHAWKPA